MCCCEAAHLCDGLPCHETHPRSRPESADLAACNAARQAHLQFSSYILVFPWSCTAAPCTQHPERLHTGSS